MNELIYRLERLEGFSRGFRLGARLALEALRA